MISIKVEGIDALLKTMDPRKVQRAAMRALERTKGQAKTESIRQITKVWNISKRNLEMKASGNPRVQVSGRVNSDLTATITFRSGGISLAYFGARQVMLSKRASKALAVKRGQKYNGAKMQAGVRVQVMKGKTTTLRQFFGEVRYGKDKAGVHRGVFRRTGKGRLPIAESQSVGVATMVAQDRVMTPLRRFIVETFEKRLQHELTREGLGS